jgi:crotonobetainyl-CoA:carnitine CoA-transferase CaiB-like acyl-CoA transferase
MKAPVEMTWRLSGTTLFCQQPFRSVRLARLASPRRRSVSDAQPLPASERPLGGVRVLDLTRVLAGPTSARTLAEHGADVLRVGTAALPDNETMMRDTGHGKRSTALGHTGPWHGRRGFDSVVQAVSGMADDNGVDGRPRFLAANPLDYMTGYLAAFGAMVALRRRQTEGGSYRVRLSLAQTGRWTTTRRIGRV